MASGSLPCPDLTQESPGRRPSGLYIHLGQDMRRKFKNVRISMKAISSSIDEENSIRFDQKK